MPDLSQRNAESRRNVLAKAARTLAGIAAGGMSLAACYGRWAREPEDSAALLRALVTDGLRWHHRLQWQLEQLLDKPMPAKDAELAALLRLGLLQLQFMRIPPHAAVDETVAATRALHRHHARGLVNAVLRRFQRERADLDRHIEDDDVARFSHPRWLIEAIRQDRSEHADAILDANNIAAPLWLRVNRQRASAATWAQQLGEHGIGFSLDDELPQAVRLDRALPTARLPGFAEGEVSPQDRSAQMATRFLDLASGQRVLDACAAPGGKTAAILERCSDLAELVALDSSAARLTTLQENLTRLHLSATIVCGDAADTRQWWDGVEFDRILLDAPCSATGVIRRHPDIKLRRTAEQVTAAVGAQKRLLAALWPLLAKEGRLVYVTCSVLRCENETQIDGFLRSFPDAVIEADRQYLPGEADGDGFYYACVKKRE